MKKFYRDEKNAWLGGVCAGLGASLNLDPSIVRIVWVVATVGTGIFLGVIAYFAAWIIMPKQA